VRRDTACAALGLVLAGAYYAAAEALPASLLADEVGADGLPKALAVLLAAVSLAIGWRGMRVDSGAAGGQHLRALGVAGLGAAYVAVVPLAGFAPALALLLLAAMRYYGAPLRLATVVYALLGACALWVVFAQVLGRAP
jgi:hypothetical protein